MEKVDIIKNKIALNRENLQEEIKKWKDESKKVVFTNGCFDIVHRGHVEYLANAASKGDVLVLGLNTDASVKRLKGETRPINDEYGRAMVLAGMSFIDKVVLFDEDTPYDLIKFIQPDVLIKGSDYSLENIVGYDIVIGKGGAVVTMDFIDGYSTSSIVEKIKKHG